MKEQYVISENALDLLEALLQLDEDKRIGGHCRHHRSDQDNEIRHSADTSAHNHHNEGAASTGRGPITVFDHPFFAGINWDHLERRMIEPPFMPPPRVLEDKPVYTDFDEVMVTTFKSQWKDALQETATEYVFKGW